jgi:hypothetical protein
MASGEIYRPEVRYARQFSRKALFWASGRKDTGDE